MTATTKGTAVVTLPADNQILITREFNAPAELVYRAYTEPELIRRWWHANRGTMTVCEVDLRVGGAWRYAMVATGGFDVGFHGTYREVVPNSRLVYTEVYEGAPDAGEDDAALNTVELREKDGRTTVAILVEHTKPEHRDFHIESGMEHGMQDAMDMLEEIAVGLG
ncbi:SRPBCC family protein [Actinokineospora sp. UTMC 2448]|uniref:SRPBCC family protein n=1 Tax=Actinokineospora sp. UTMC 2448 TaxID=2268449 RepID=UPI002164BFF6|nr:SRPBCC family protein [Actinokineospora sp. UTMC 2448]UVS81395.1 Activator of Hsp90 ATPase [Actinokineospora sp. UTMC 2448]